MTSTRRLSREQTKKEREAARIARHEKRNSPARKMLRKRKRLIEKAVAIYLAAEEARLKKEGKTFTVEGYRKAHEFAKRQAEGVFLQAESKDLIMSTALAVANAGVASE